VIPPTSRNVYYAVKLSHVVMRSTLFAELHQLLVFRPGVLLDGIDVLGLQVPEAPLSLDILPHGQDRIRPVGEVVFPIFVFVEREYAGVHGQRPYLMASSDGCAIRWAYRQDMQIRRALMAAAFSTFSMRSKGKLGQAVAT